jgi:hypothetical protein
MVSRYRSLSYSLETMSRAAKVAKELRASTYAKLYVYETLLEWLAQGLEHMTAALRSFIQEEHPVVRA